MWRALTGAVLAFGGIAAGQQNVPLRHTPESPFDFNGAAAIFRVVSPSEIETKVPSGATSGRVQVTTPSGTLSSNVAFRVIP